MGGAGPAGSALGERCERACWAWTSAWDSGVGPVRWCSWGRQGPERLLRGVASVSATLALLRASPSSGCVESSLQCSGCTALRDQSKVVVTLAIAGCGRFWDDGEVWDDLQSLTQPRCVANGSATKASRRVFQAGAQGQAVSVALQYPLHTSPALLAPAVASNPWDPTRQRCSRLRLSWQ